MMLFAQREIKSAYAHAADGGQALHVISGTYAYLRNDTPAVFKNRHEIAHLIDNNIVRLMATARRLGVRVIKVERAQRVGQHIDLCGKPLEKARAECSQPEFQLSTK